VSRKRIDAIEKDLRKLLAGDVEFDDISRALYATDAGLNQIEPLGVVSPRDTEDVVRVVDYARERGIELVPRGMGSGLTGGAVGSGLQIDFTRYMNRVVEVAGDGSWARVQPGVVMGELNRYLGPRGVFFAPDPSSENYCSLGGMISNNSSGARTVAYGGTKDHVLALDVVLDDGRPFRAAPLGARSPELASLLAGPTRAARAFGAVLPLLADESDAIAASMPRVVKNCSGYRIETIIDGDIVHLQKMFIGAEGTLGLVTEATLNLVPLPVNRGIAMVYFPSVFASGEAVPGILALKPTAVEIMDSRFLTFVRKHNSFVDAMLPDRTDTALLIEFEGADAAELDDKFAALARHLGATEALKMVRAASAEETDRLWTVRKSAVALALRMPGPRRAAPFIEDVTVHPDEVPRYVDFLQRLFDELGVEAVMYGHVGDGNIHTRPMLDPKGPGDIRTMQLIYDRVSEYVLGVRGTMSGEHGDGLIRSPYVKQMYGEEIYDIFRQVKEAFDPLGMMNPGKKIVAESEAVGMQRMLRYGPDYRTVAQQPLLHFPGGEYEGEIEKCHGCGQCKSTVATTMCPIFKANRREHASPRAKANMLRHIITGALDPKSTYGREAAKLVEDYCIVCGMCAVECPSNVNIPKLMLEAKSKYREEHAGHPVEMLLGRAEAVSQLGHLAAPVANRLLNQPAIRQVGEILIGIDRRRRMAPFARTTLGQILGRSKIPTARARGVGVRRAVLFYDIFANYNDPGLALLAEAILRRHGVEVVYPRQRGSGIPEMLYGYAKRARGVARYNVAAALPFVEEGGVLLSFEPTAGFAFKVHYPDYLGDVDSSLVANAARDFGEFLAPYRKDHPERSPVPRPLPLRVAYHQPCHLKAQQIGSPSRDLLAETPGLELVDLDACCCGMAGTFGMKARSYDLSMLAGRPLFNRISEADPELILSECSTCRLQIGQATGLPTAHPLALLGEVYGCETNEVAYARPIVIPMNAGRPGAGG
jgi:FAD/FMN-containing dehydrogenase/Fe-S oxidoreductase